MWYDRDMNADKRRRKPGRPPIGKKAMTDAERKRRSLEKLRQEAGVPFAVRIADPVWEHLDVVGKAMGRDARDVLRQVLAAALDRFMAVNRTALAMSRAGASRDELLQFWGRNLF